MIPAKMNEMRNVKHLQQHNPLCENRRKGEKKRGKKEKGKPWNG